MTAKPRAAMATVDTIPRCVIPAKPTTADAITNSARGLVHAASARARSEGRSSCIPSASGGGIAMHQYIGYQPETNDTTASRTGMADHVRQFFASVSRIAAE